MNDLLEKVKSVFSGGSLAEDLEDDFDDDYEEKEQSNFRRTAAEQYEERARRLNSYNFQPREKVVSIHQDQKDMKVVVISPRGYDDARTVCDNLKAWAPCIVKLDKLQKDDAQRVVDFIMGACYTMDGHVQEIKEDVFLVAPSMVNIEKELDDVKSMKSNNSFFAKFSVR